MTHQPVRPARSRLAWVDIARGVLVVLVVAGHDVFFMARRRLGVRGLFQLPHWVTRLFDRVWREASPRAASPVDPAVLVHPWDAEQAAQRPASRHLPEDPRKDAGPPLEVRS